MFVIKDRLLTELKQDLCSTQKEKKQDLKSGKKKIFRLNVIGRHRGFIKVIISTAFIFAKFFFLS